MNKVKLSLIVLVCINANIFAGSLEPPGPPGSSNSAMYTIEAVYQRLDNGTPGTKWTGGFREPTAPPGSTMHNLNEVMAKAPSRDDSNGATTNDVRSDKIFWGLTTNEWGTQTGTGTRTLSADTSTVNAGYYEATNLTLVDTNLVSNNIRGYFTIFGVTGAVYSPVPRTGQTNTYGLDDDSDGALQRGVAWPVPRFTTNAVGPATNVVIDNLTGLMWTKNANIPGLTYPLMDWTNAMLYCSTNLNIRTNDVGEIVGYGGYTNWHLPNRKELLSLINCEYCNFALSDTTGTNQWTDGDPFTNVDGNRYWTSTTYAGNPAYAWYVWMTSGNMDRNELKTGTAGVIWPVRGP